MFDIKGIKAHRFAFSCLVIKTNMYVNMAMSGNRSFIFCPINSDRSVTQSMLTPI